MWTYCYVGKKRSSREATQARTSCGSIKHRSTKWDLLDKLSMNTTAATRAHLSPSGLWQPKPTTHNQSHLSPNPQLINQLKNTTQYHSSAIHQSSLCGGVLLRTEHQIYRSWSQDAPTVTLPVHVNGQKKEKRWKERRKQNARVWSEQRGSSQPSHRTPPAPEYSCRQIRYHGGAQLFIMLLQKETHHCPIVMEY